MVKPSDKSPSVSAGSGSTKTTENTTVQIFILTMASRDLCADQNARDNADDILLSGRPFLTLEAAQAAAQAEVDEEWRDLCDGEEDEDAETERGEPLKWDMIKAKDGVPHQWEAWDETTETDYMIRSFDLGTQFVEREEM